MSEWRIELMGETIDLQCACQDFVSGEPNIIQEENQYFLRANEFNTMEDAANVNDRAKEITKLVSDAVYFHYRESRPIRVGRLIRIDDMGKRHYFVFGEGNIQLRGVVAGLVASESQTVNTEHNAIRIFHAASSNKDIADALAYFSQGDWSNLYKTFELVRDFMRNESLPVKSNWVTKKDLDRFTQTAQSREAIGDSARHASKKFKPPKNPMSIHEARAFVGTLLEQWINEISIS